MTASVPQEAASMEAGNISISAGYPGSFWVGPVLSAGFRDFFLGLMKLPWTMKVAVNAQNPRNHRESQGVRAD